jgi:hypothetical protein
MDTPHMLKIAKVAHRQISERLLKQAEVLKSVDESFAISRGLPIAEKILDSVLMTVEDSEVVKDFVNAVTLKFGGATDEDKKTLDDAINELATDYKDLDALRNEIRLFEPLFDEPNQPELPL